MSCYVHGPFEHVLPCIGTCWTFPTMYRDLLTLSFHEQRPVEHVVLCTETCWTCPAMFWGLLTLSFHEQRPVEHILPCSGTCWARFVVFRAGWTCPAMFRALLNMSCHVHGPFEHVLPCTGTCRTFCAIHRDLLNISCHLQEPVESIVSFTDTCWTCRAIYRAAEHVMPCSGTYWPCPSINWDLLNMLSHVQGPVEHVLPQLQQDVRQFPCRGLLAFLHSDRSHAEPQRHDSQVHMPLGKLEAMQFFL